MTTDPRAVKAMYQSSFTAFIGLSFRLLFPNRIYYSHWVTTILGDALERCARGECSRLILNLPPRYLKSVAASIALPAWILARRPETNILCVGGHRGLVSGHHFQSYHLMTHPKYRALFPHVKATDTGHTIRLDYGGTRTGATPSGGITGRGADYIIIDDPLAATAAHDDAKRKALNQWYDDNIYQRLDEKSKGVVIVVMQRLHTEDLTAHLLKQDGWDLISLTAIAEADEVLPRLFGQRILRSKGDALQPQLESREQLRSAMLQMGAKAFMAQYQQRPYPVGEGEGKRGYYSSLRKGVRWKPTADMEDVFEGFTHVTEERILLHTVFGEGQHPWPEDMRFTLDDEEIEDGLEFLRKLHRESVEKRAQLEHAKLDPNADSHGQQGEVDDGFQNQ